MDVSFKGACFILALVIAAGCADKNPVVPAVVDEVPAPQSATPPSGISLSNSVVIPTTGRKAYVSVAPETYPAGITATLTNRTRHSDSISVVMVNGGFDPVGIDADAGDEIGVSISGSSGETVSYGVKVPPRKPPSIVRTNPSKGRTDVALNVLIAVVFSEPIETSTISKFNVQLRQGEDEIIPGNLTWSDDRLAVFLKPTFELSPGAQYTLRISNVRDLDGDVIEGESVIQFQTRQKAPPAIEGTIAFTSNRDGTAHIYLASPDGSGVKRLTNSIEAEYGPAWSPDGQLLAFYRDDGTFVIKRDGSGLTRLGVGAGAPSWSPDGRRILVSTANGLRIVAANGSAEDEMAIDIRPVPAWFADSLVVPWRAAWSPDGSRIAFSAWTVYDFERAFVMNVDGSGARTFVNPVPPYGATWDECAPVWSPDGNRIALLGGVFGGSAPGAAFFGVGIVDPEDGNETTIMAPGTTCWDGNLGAASSGIAWSPDGKSLAITRRTPGYSQTQPFPTNQEASISIVEIATAAVLVVIPDAYSPAWTNAK